MARINWSVPGTRLFEMGVDRGVYYGPNNASPWEGLISVNETTIGGAARPYYIDGIKRINIAEAEEYSAIISSYTRPNGFGDSEGVKPIHNGLLATQQVKSPFGFSYRTGRGNDIFGNAFGYRVHLVYNALAEAGSIENQSISDSTNPMILSWKVTTLPLVFRGYRPTSHIVIDSLTTPKGLLKHIENVLYGSETEDPRLPLPDELVDLFNSEGPITRRNLVANPSFRLVRPGEVSVIRKNYATDRKPGSSNDSYVTLTNNAIWSGEAWTKIHTSSAGWGAMQHLVGLESEFPISSTVTASVTIANPSDTESLDYKIDLNTSDYKSGTLSPLQTRRVFMTLILTGPLIRFHIYSEEANRNLLFKNILIERTTQVHPYFDGDTPDDGTTIYSWLGSPFSSASIMTGLPVLGWYGGNGGTIVRKGFYDKYTGVVRNSLWFQTTVVEGAISDKYYAARVTVQSIPGETLSTTVTIKLITDAIDLSAVEINLPLDGSSITVDVLSGVGSENASYVVLSLVTLDASIRVSDVIVVEVDGPGKSAGNFFDGSTASADGYFYDWAGVADESVSVERTWH